MKKKVTKAIAIFQVQWNHTYGDPTIQEMTEEDAKVKMDFLNCKKRIEGNFYSMGVMKQNNWELEDHKELYRTIRDSVLDTSDGSLDIVEWEFTDEEYLALTSH